MRAKFLLSAAALAVAVAMPTMASAVPAQAITDLNLRSGPGPQYPVVGVIDTNNQANVRGCIEGSLWCEVTYKGKTAWAYSKYLAMERGGKTVVITEHPQEMGVPVVTYTAPAGAATGVVSGDLVGRPVRATVGAATTTITAPPPPVRTYVLEHQVEPVYLNGEVVVGAGVPDTVVLHPVPDYQYDYAYVNSVPVLVNPTSREIVYVYR